MTREDARMGNATRAQSHDDWLLEGHDEGRDGEGLCPNCQESIEDQACRCCPICEGDGRVTSGAEYEICPACEGWGLLKPAIEIPPEGET